MLYVLLVMIIFAVIIGPSLWVKYVFKRYASPLDRMPGTGGELAQHLVERFKLEGVQVVLGEKDSDHYNPQEKIISLSPVVYEGKSLTAVAIATHEVGHAIQFCRDESVSHLRQKYMGKALAIQRVGSIILMAMPVVTVLVRIPHLVLLGIAIGIITMLVSVLMYVAILPEEYDASFKKALPILKDGYVPEEYIPAIEKILKAAALTYVAAALADVLRLWRWIRVIR